MKLYVEIQNVEDPGGWGAGSSAVPLDEKDLALPLDEFVERYLKPAFVNAKQRFEEMKCTEA